MYNDQLPRILDVREDAEDRGHEHYLPRFQISIEMRSSETSLCSGSSLPWAVFQLLIITTNIDASWAAAAAVTKTPAISSAGTPYFDYETQQLTDEVIERLRDGPDAAEYAGLFEFDNGVDPDDDVLPQLGKCKVFPGDEDWPSEKKWDKFNELLGNALIATTPLAAPCYPSWGEYGTAKCEEIGAKWTDAYFQYACLFALRIPPHSFHLSYAMVQVI